MEFVRLCGFFRSQVSALLLSLSSVNTYSGGFISCNSCAACMQVLKESAAIRREQLASEISSLLKVHHPNIVQFLGACTREEPLMIVSELMEGAHLLGLICQVEWRE